MYNNGNSSKNVTGASVVDGTLENADYADNGLSGDKIDGGIISNFQSTGIDDRLPTGKVLTLSDTNTKLSGSISFNGDTAAANALDDYETGTWTPSVDGDATYTARNGTYTKIGNLVRLDFDMTINVLGTGSTQTVTGLPFTYVGMMGMGAYVTYWGSLATAVMSVAGTGGVTAIKFRGSTSASTSLPNGAIFGNGARLAATIMYKV
jgi:hypothetical protein